jgi:hypothetical protein
LAKASYTKNMKTTQILIPILLLLAVPAVLATEIYHWVDKDGVPHYSQNPPPADTGGVDRMILEDTSPPNLDPEEDLYNVEEQQKRMASIRQEREEKREAERERRAKVAAQQPTVIYQQSQPYSYPFWNSGIYPRPPINPGPPVRPQPPIAVPYSVPFSPPGLNR